VIDADNGETAEEKDIDGPVDHAVPGEQRGIAEGNLSARTAGVEGVVRYLEDDLNDAAAGGRYRRDKVDEGAGRFRRFLLIHKTAPHNQIPVGPDLE